MRRLDRWIVGAVASALLAVGLPAVSMPAAAGVAAAGEHVQPTGDGSWRDKPPPKPAPFSWKSPKGKNTPLVKTDPHAKRVKELTQRRTATASFFRMSDGSVQEQLSATPVHYRDSHGVWQDIDSSVRPVSHAGFTLGSTGNSFQTYFGSTASALLRVEQGGSWIEMGLDGAHVSAPKVSADTVTYPKAYPGTDISYESGPDGVKESIVLSTASAAASFSFTLKVSGFTPKRLADGAIAFYGESADPVLVIPAPYMSDAKPDASSPYGYAYSAKVSQSMSFDAASGTLHLTVKPDASWLSDKKRVFPVTIDPTILVSSTSSTAANTMILADGPSTNYDSSWRMSVGTTATGAARSLIKFALPSVPAGTTLTSADLRLYYDQTFSGGSSSAATVPMQALAANAAWDPTTATWSNASSIGGPVAGTATMTASALGVWNDFPVTSTVQAWLNGTSANNGFVLKASTETLGQGGPRYEKSGYFYNGEVKNYPQLVIDYGVPGVTVNAPTVIHSTGAELSWPAYSNSTGNTGNDIAEYQVHRSIYQTFTPTASTEISPVIPSQTSFVDSTAVPTPANNSDPYGNAYYYMVVVKTKSGQLIPGPTTVVRLPEAGRTTLLIPAQSATTLSSKAPTSVLNTLNNGGTQQPWVEVGDNSATYGVARSIFDFPALSAIPSGSTVLDAHLKLWQEQTYTNSSGAVYELHALTRPFTGSQATWDVAATGTNWTSPGGDYNAAKDGTVSGLTNDPNRQNFDATGIVQGWVDNPASNDGLLIKLSAESSTSPQERTVFAGPATAEPALAPTLVVTYLDNSTGSTYYAPSTPADMVTGTTYAEPVTVNNTTTSTWAASSEVLTYHWQLPDGTDVTAPGNQVQTPLPSDLAPAATVTLNAQVTPPTPTDGNQAEGATLAWDMYNKITGTYLSGATTAVPVMSPAAMVRARQAAATSGGTGSLQQQVSVDPSGNNQLGLEKFYPYATTPTGSGSTLYSNTASGNTVWNNDLFSNPSIGFDTTLRMSYNSMSTMDTTTGFGWSLEASAPIRLGSALQFQPPGNPTSMVMVDGTGNAHQWNLVNGTWQSPPGVHLFLQGTACKPQDTNARAWKMTRPDRTTIYFDCEGYPTAQIDRNGNEADFSYTSRQSQNKPEEFLDEITDRSGIQTLTVAYYQKGDASYQYLDSTGALVTAQNLTDPAIYDHVKSITDVSGRTIDFYYTSQGLLGRYVDGAGTSIAKTFNFTYDATQGMKNVKLVAVQDPRGNTTNVAYDQTSSPTKWWTQTVTDRMGHTTAFAYTQPGTTVTTETTVTDVYGGKWIYDTDSSGRLTKQVDPAIQATPTGASAPVTVTPTTTIGWDGDNNVVDLTENNGAHSHWVYDQNTGYPTTYQDPVAYKAGASVTYVYDTVDTLDSTLSGHIADLSSVSSADTPSRITTFTYTTDGKGNLATEVSPDGNAAGAAQGSYTTSYGYDQFGQVVSVKDANGNTTTYNYTHIAGPGGETYQEPTGQPIGVTDPMVNTTSYVYGSRGELTSATDALGHTTTAGYDVFLRPTGGQTPKDQASGSYVVTPAPTYDGNDNVTSSTAPYITGYPVANSSTTTVYDKDDQPSTVTLPANTTATSPAARTVTYGYDYTNHQITVTEPLGSVSGATAATAANYTTTSHYDAVNEADWISKPNPDGTANKTQFGYDDVGNQITVTDPRGNKTTAGYDLDHRVTGTTDASGHTTAAGYDLDGLTTSATDQKGNTTLYGLDADGRVIEVDVPRAVDKSTSPYTVTSYDITKYVYDQVGNNLAVISPKGVAAGSKDATGAFTTSTQYDADNRVSKVLGAFDPNNALYKSDQQPETDYHYDAASRVTGIDLIRKANSFVSASPTSQEDAKTAYTYWDNGWTRTSTDPYNIKTSYDYNGRGQQNDRLLTSSDGTEPTTDTSAGSGVTRDMHWLYNPDGSLWQTSDTGLPGGWQDQILPADANGSAGWTAGPAGGGYDGATYYTSGTGTFQWNFAVPENGDYKVYIWYSTAGTGSPQYSYYDNSGANHPLGSVNQTANAGSWQVLNGGNTINLVAGSKQVLQLTPQESGDVADAIKIVCTDCGGTANGTTQTDNFTYSYDANGNLSDLADQSPTAQYDDYKPTFDNLNRLTQVLENKSGATVHTLKYGYNAASNLTSQSQDTSATGNISAGTFTYNTLNQLTQVADTQNSGAALTTSYTYYPNGQLHTETKGNNNLVTDSYNPNNTLLSSIETTSGGATVDQHVLGYDANNNITSDAITLQNSGGGTLTQNSTLAYSPNNQVVSVTNGQDDQNYVYDSAGNIEQDKVKDPTTSNTITTDFAYQRDRLYKANADGSATGGTYQYDTLGRLGEVVGGQWLNVGTVNQSYKYDGFDNITYQSSTGANNELDATTSTYDSLNRVTTQALSANGTQTQSEKLDYLGTSGTVAGETVSIPASSTVPNGDTITKTYDYSANGERLALLNHDPDNAPAIDQTEYYTYNHHGDVEALTDGTTGSTSGTYGYTAYGVDDKSLDSGVDTVGAGPTTFPFNPYRYNSARVSSTNGTLDMGARTYDPNINRFVSRDSYDAAGADAGLSGATRYGFAGGNPISNVEQDGHSFWSVLGGIAVGVAVVGGCALGGAATGGLIMAGCILGGAVLGTLASQTITCGQSGWSGSDCSAAAFGKAAENGAVFGAAAAATTLLLPAGLTGWAVAGISGAAGGAANYAFGCTQGSPCSWQGFAAATATSAVLSAAFGAVLGKAFGGFGEASEGEVPYQSTRLSRLALAERVSADNLKTRNVAVFETASGDRAVAISERGVGHAERLAWAELAGKGVKPEEVTKIYSELEPCNVPGGYCSRWIQATFPNAKVTWSFEYGDTVASRRAGVAALQAELEKLLG